MLLQVAGLTKRYGHLTALSEVSFSIRPGEVLGVIGPNGSGKTTLFECLGGVLPADGGTVLRDTRPLTAAERISTLFYLPDLTVPWPSQTVRWALAFVSGYWGLTPMSRAGAKPGSDPLQTETIVRRLEVDPLLDVRIDALSKGQRKRFLLAIGLVTPQPVLLADEPFDGLDLRQTREVAAILRTCAAAGRTLVLSIHQIRDAARVCDRFVLLSGGTVRGEGTLEELSEQSRSGVGGESERGQSGVRHRADADLEEIFLALT